MTRDDYLALLQALLPTGAALPREADSVVTALLGVPAAELARIEAAAADLLEEADPRTTVQLLAEWEAEFGLPDDCDLATAATTEERRAALLARITGQGGQSATYFISLAATMGYPGATVEEFPIARIGRSRIGDSLNSYAWSQTWRLRLAASGIRVARVGSSSIGDRLRSWGDERLECAVRGQSPAHTLVLFAYGA
ncbi:MAG: DUF2313 domain-containing protein [Roseomonas sp.]|nr:DUF2313 domain-containing protein [Roseomonas sp.]